MRILITGATGQVGSALSKRLMATPQDFLALSHSDLDICNKAEVLKKLLAYQPDIIINAAAYTAVDKAESDEKNAYMVNCEGVINLAEAAIRIDAALFHLSTDYVFSGEDDHGYREQDSPRPQSIYGKSKLAGEQALAELTSKHLIIRTSWAFSEHGNNFIKRLLLLGHEHAQLDMVTNQWGSPTYAGDIAEMLLTITKAYESTDNINWGLYHYAGKPSISRFELATYVFAQAVNQGLYKQAPILNPISSAQYPTAAKRPRSSILDCVKICDAFGIMPSNWQAALMNLSDYLVSKQ